MPKKPKKVAKPKKEVQKKKDVIEVPSKEKIEKDKEPISNANGISFFPIKSPAKPIAKPASKKPKEVPFGIQKSVQKIELKNEIPKVANKKDENVLKPIEKPKKSLSPFAKAMLLRQQGAFYDPKQFQVKHNHDRLMYQLPYYQLPYLNPLQAHQIAGDKLRDDLREYRQMITHSGSPVKRLIALEQQQKKMEEKDRWETPQDVPPRYQNSDSVPWMYFSKFGSFNWNIDTNVHPNREYMSSFVAFGPSATSHTFPRADQLRTPNQIAFYGVRLPDKPNPEIVVLQAGNDNLPETFGLQRDSGYIIMPVTERTTLVTRNGVLKAINVNGENKLLIPFKNNRDDIYQLSFTPMVRYGKKK